MTAYIRSPEAEVVVTGIGMSLPQCDDRATFWKHVSHGASQLRLHHRPDNPTLMCAMGRTNLDLDEGPLRDLPVAAHAQHYPRDVQLYLAAVCSALRDASVKLPTAAPERVGLFDGTSRSSFDYFADLLTSGAAAELTRHHLAVGTPGQAVGLAAALWGVQGPNYTFSSACSAASIAIGHAYREIHDGRLDLAIAGGHDSVLDEPIYRMYAEAGLLSSETEDPARAVRPYTQSTGNAFGEGALVLVLESRQYAEWRGATMLASVAGYAYGNNGVHPTRVDPEGHRPAQVIRQLLKESGHIANQIDFVIGHGNAAPQSDRSEALYMRQVFGSRSADVPLISTKPIYGHTLGASGAINIATAVLMLHHGFIPPTPNVEPDLLPEGLNVPTGQGMWAKLSSGLSMTFGLGGHNAAVLVDHLKN
ncbi:beta-ketoacyl-[acyl-carrier-protein] synthase family protein [Streptomyces virginiae]